MANSEIDSFVTKFKYLCHAGFRASLTLEAVNGEASAVLQSCLGPLHSPHVPRHHGQPPRHRGPAYERRQQRRQAAHAAAVQAPSLAVKARDAPPSDHSGPADEASEVATVVADESEASVDEKTAANAEHEFKCLICDFTSNWGNGLQLHMTRKHNTIDQIDGN